MRRSSRLVTTSSISAGTGSSWSLSSSRDTVRCCSSHLFGSLLEVNACRLPIPSWPPRVGRDLWNAKLAFHKVASFHQHFNRHTTKSTSSGGVMAYADDITIMLGFLDLLTQARVQPRNTYNHTYIKCLP